MVQNPVALPRVGFDGKRVRWKWRHRLMFPQRFRWLKRASSFPLRFRKRFCIQICCFQFLVSRMIKFIYLYSVYPSRWGIIGLTNMISNIGQFTSTIPKRLSDWPSLPRWDCFRTGLYRTNHNEEFISAQAVHFFRVTPENRKEMCGAYTIQCTLWRSGCFLNICGFNLGLFLTSCIWDLFYSLNVHLNVFCNR